MAKKVDFRTVRAPHYRPAKAERRVLDTASPPDAEWVGQHVEANRLHKPAVDSLTESAANLVASATGDEPPHPSDEIRDAFDSAVTAIGEDIGLVLSDHFAELRPLIMSATPEAYLDLTKAVGRFFIAGEPWAGRMRQYPGVGLFRLRFVEHLEGLPGRLVAAAE